MIATLSYTWCIALDQDLIRRMNSLLCSMMCPIEDEENEGYFDGTSEFFDDDDDDVATDELDDDENDSDDDEDGYDKDDLVIEDEDLG